MYSGRNTRYNAGYSIERIRMEASSKTIHKTIRKMETASGIRFPRGNTPTESLDLMIDMIASRLR